MDALRTKLLAWYARERRDLPWRRSGDPWAILVSEIMLQQTRVEVVVPYFERFLARFPTPQDLAAGADDEVLRLWAGLGYYRRARNLKAAAAAIAERHGGAFPRTHAEILELPGVGRYTAGAVASIAFGLPEPLVDGNVARVLARLFVEPGDLRRPAEARRFWSLAAELLDPERPGDFNQALMELGATVCLPRSPRCLLCPLQDSCLARKQGAIDRFPTPRTRRPSVAVELAAALVLKDGAVGLVRRAPGSVMEGLYDLPAVEIESGADAVASVTALLRERFGIRVKGAELCGAARHTITHRKVRASVVACSHAGRQTASLIRETRAERPGAGIAPIADAAGLRFAGPGELVRLGLSSLARKLLAAGARPAADQG